MFGSCFTFDMIPDRLPSASNFIFLGIDLRLGKFESGGFSQITCHRIIWNVKLHYIYTLAPQSKIIKLFCSTSLILLN